MIKKKATDDCSELIVDTKGKKYCVKTEGNGRLFRAGKKEIKLLTSDETVTINGKLYTKQCQGVVYRPPSH